MPRHRTLFPFAAALAAGLTLTALGASAQEEAVDPILAEAFVCFGNEPFWQMQVEGNAARWSAPSADGIIVGAPVGRFDRAEWGNPPTASWIGLLPPSLIDGLDAAADAAAQATALVIERRACADSMADTTHALSAWLTHPAAGLVAGCCEPQVIAAPSPADPDQPPIWPMTAGDFDPAIRACLSASADHDRVAAAIAEADGGLRLRLSTPRRERVDCIISALPEDGTAPIIDALVPVPGDAPDLPGEGDGLVQTAAAAVVGACHRATPLTPADATALPDPGALIVLRAVCTDPPLAGE